MEHALRLILQLPDGDFKHLYSWWLVKGQVIYNQLDSSFKLGYISHYLSRIIVHCLLNNIILQVIE